MITAKNNPNTDAPILRYQPMVQGEQSPFIATVDCHVEIDGLIAEVKKTFTLFNPNPRDMEGELLVPLPSDSILCNYFLDIGGKMRKAVVVSKQQGRQILETEIRKKVDPGLVEKVEGNIHRIRIYPLPSMGWRTVSITWLTELSLSASSAYLHLPMGYMQSVDESTLVVENFSRSHCPCIVDNNSVIPFQESENGWIYKTILKKEQHVDELRVQVPLSQVGTIASFEESSGCGRFFSLNCAIPDSGEKESPWQPARIALAWDASGSSDTKSKEVKLLSQLIAHWQDIIVDLIVFRDVVEPGDMHTFTIKNGHADELFLWLQQISYDGATNLSSLQLAKLLHPEVEACFLLSDGLSNLGDKQRLLSPVPLHAICSSAKNNAALLQHQAQQNGGHFYNLLTQKSEDIAIEIINNRPVVRILRTHGCGSVHLREGSGRISLVGYLLHTDCAVKLVQGTKSFSCVFSISTAEQVRNVAKLWAFQEAEKCFFLDCNSAKVTILAQKFGLVTSGTSLLVLEDVEQYLEHNVEPPREEDELFSQYRKLYTEHTERDTKSRNEHLDALETQWRELIAWWNGDFPRVREKEVLFGGIGEGEGNAALKNVEIACYSMGGAVEMCAPALCSAEDNSAFETDNDQDEPEQSVKKILLQEWSAKAHYLQEIKESSVEKRYQCYLDIRSDYALSPSFFLNCGDYFLKNDCRNTGIRILSNLLEISRGNPSLMRTCAYRLQQAGELDMAVEIFSEVLAVRDDEPQSYRDLALVLGERWQRDKQEEDLFSAMLLFWSVIEQEWSRFPEIELIALQELNRLIWIAQENCVAVPGRIEQRFIQNLDLDLRLTLSWDADLTDVDLHVYEPDGSHAYYGNKKSPQGARVSRDVMDGYGPEEYILRKADKGLYTIKAHYYASHQQTIYGPCTVTVTLYTDYARENEQRQVMVLQLAESGAEFTIGSVEI